MPKSPYKPYTPDPEQMALFPDVSGNTINGMGEKSFRKATPVYWRDPGTLAHGRLQQWFYTQDPDNEAIAAERAKRQSFFEVVHYESSFISFRSFSRPRRYQDAAVFSDTPCTWPISQKVMPL